MINNQKMDFIDCGRVTELLLHGLKRQSALPKRILISDPDTNCLRKIAEIAPKLIQSVKNNQEAAQADLDLLAVHLPAIVDVSVEIKNSLLFA